MKKVTKNNKITTDDLAIMVAKGFDNIKMEINEVKDELKEAKKELRGEINEVKENIRITRNDVLNIGDKFVSYHTFDQLASRVNNLEKKVNKK